MQANTDIRREIQSSCIRFWQVADGLGMTDSSFSRKLRTELPAEEKDRIRAIIKEIAERGE